jgi:hypothetical protein
MALWSRILNKDNSGKIQQKISGKGFCTQCKLQFILKYSDLDWFIMGCFKSSGKPCLVYLYVYVSGKPCLV